MVEEQTKRSETSQDREVEVKMNCFIPEEGEKRRKPMIQYSDVRPRAGGPYTLFCYTCRRWIPNTANHEMRKEGVYAYSHSCCKENGKVTVWQEEGIPEREV